MQIGEKELTEYRSGHGCNTQVGSRNFEKKKRIKVKAIKNGGPTKKTTEASQLPTPLCYSARVGNITVGDLLWLFHLQAARQKNKFFDMV